MSSGMVMRSPTSRAGGPLWASRWYRNSGLVGLIPDLPDINGLLNIGWTGIGLYRIYPAGLLFPLFLESCPSVLGPCELGRGRHHATFPAPCSSASSRLRNRRGTFSGSLTFSNRFTNHPYADFLLGIPTTAARSFPAIGDWPCGGIIRSSPPMTSRSTPG